MKRWLYGVMLMSALAGAQTLSTTPHGEDPVQLERERIQAARQASEARYAEATKRCYQQFDVNACLANAREIRRESEADLKRQELTLNDAQRLQQGAFRHKEIEDKSNSDATQARAEKAVRAAQRASERDQQNRDKAMRRQQELDEKAQSRSARDEELRQRESKRRDKAAQAHENKEQGLQRQHQARDHRDALALKQSQQEKAAPLPAGSAAR